MSDIKLSICVATFNRARFIGPLLESVVPQLTDECEIVISDNASTDDTAQIVAAFSDRCARVHYARQASNVGIDRNFDRAIELAHGEYCWLMADDDLLMPAAIATVLDALRRDLSLVIVNYERRDLTMSKVLLPRCMEISSNRLYGAEEMDRLFVDAAEIMVYVGCIIIRRTIWLRRERKRYYDSMLSYLGVIFQERLPGAALLIAEPLVSYRDGNSRSFWNEMFEIFMIKWPELVWSLAPSDAAKMKLTSREPWRNTRRLIEYRALGFYSLAEYRRWIKPRLHSLRDRFLPALIAVAPGILVNFLVVRLSSRTHDRLRDLRLLWFGQSRFHVRNLRIFKGGA